MNNEPHMRTNVMTVEQGSVEWKYEKGKEYKDREFEVTFRTRFCNPPIVQLAIEHLDECLHKWGSLKFEIQAKKITTSGMVVRVWAESDGSIIYGCRIRWLAIGDDGVESVLLTKLNALEGSLKAGVAEALKGLCQEQLVAIDARMEQLAERERQVAELVAAAQRHAEQAQTAHDAIAAFLKR